MGQKSFKLTLIVLFLLMTIGSFIQALMPALMPTLTELYSDMTTGKIGYIVGATTFTTAGSGVLMGYLGDKIKRMKVAFIGSIITTIFTFGSGFIQTYVQLFIMQVGISIGIGTIFPLMAGIIADMFQTDARSRAFSILSILQSVLGILIGTVVALLLTAETWKYVYFVMGGISLIFTFLLLTVKEPKRGAKEEALSTVYKEDPTLDYAYKIKFSDLRYLWKRKTNLYLILNFVDNVPFAVLGTFAIAWVIEEHSGTEESAFIMLIIVILGSYVGTGLFGRMGDKRFKKNPKIRVWLGTVLSMASAPFVLIAINLNWHLEPDASIFSNPLAIITMLGLAIALFFDGGIYPNWLSAITDVNVPEHRGTMISLANFFDACGRSLGAILGGYLIDHYSYTSAMTLTSLFTILSFVWWVPSLKTFIPDYKEVKKILEERALLLQKK